MKGFIMLNILNTRLRKKYCQGIGEDEEILNSFSGFNFKCLLTPLQCSLLKEYVLYGCQDDFLAIKYQISRRSLRKIWKRIGKKLFDFVQKKLHKKIKLKEDY